MGALMSRRFRLLTMIAALLGLAGCRERREVVQDLLQMRDQSDVIDDTRRIDFGDEEARAHCSGSTWSGDEHDQRGRTFVWALTRETTLSFSVVIPQDTLAVINCRAFPRPDLRQTMAVSVNREPVGTPVELQPDFKEYRFFLPVRVLHRGSNALTFSFGYAGVEDASVASASTRKGHKVGATQPGPVEKRPLSACFDYINFVPYDRPEQRAVDQTGAGRPLAEWGLKESEVLREQSSSTISYYVVVPDASLKPRLDAECALPSTFAGKMASFRVEIQTDGAAPAQITQVTANSGKKVPLSVTLDPWAGRIVRLTLTVESDAPSGLWVRPRLTGIVRPRTREDGRVTDARQKLAKSNLLIILLDAGGAEHFGCYGYPLDTTPNIDRLAREGIQFTNAYCNAVYTTASTGSLMTGLYPDIHRVLYSKNRLPESADTLAEMLRSRGLRTAAFIANSNAGALRGYEQGFQDYVELFRFEDFGSLCVNQNKWLFPWLDKNRGNQFFLYLHFREPHFGGLPPQEFLDKFSTAYTGSIDVLNDREKINRGQRSMTDAELKHITSVYDATLNYADYEIGLVVDKLKQLGIWDNTMTIVLADHGEALWEHGYFGHNVQVYQNMAHIPLIVSPPAGSVPVARKIGSIVQTVDLCPTMADVSGLPELASKTDGHSILDLLAVPDSRRNGAAYTRTLWTTPTYGVRYGPWEYVFATRNSTAELYDLRADPGEKRNILAEHPVLATYFGHHLQHWIGVQKARARAMSSPETTRMDDATKKNLGGLGYIDATTGRDLQEENESPH